MAPIFTGLKLGFGAAGGVIGKATGGNVSALAPGNGYIYHTFTSPGTFTASISLTVEVLVVAGGGGGGGSPGGNSGGGGGAGGLVIHPGMAINSGSYPVSVGDGGNPGPGPFSGTVGTQSVFNGLTALGGGAGGGYQFPGGNGGSGGGGGGYGDPYGSSPVPGSQPTQPQSAPPGYLQYGTAGGTSSPGNPGSAGGGGGAGGSGGNDTSGVGGVGLRYPQFTGILIGVPSLAPLSGYFAGGGGGGEYSGTKPGGLGGGGRGIGTPGTTNSGGGGGGGAVGSGGTGGPGIVIIRYLA